MGKKSTPKPPDPQETAAAQTGTNVSTAVANAYLNNTNQYTPNASLEYQKTGSHSWTDPSTGQTYQIPTFSSYQTLSPEQEAISKAGNIAELNLANLAAGQSGRLQDLLGRRITYEGIPDRPSLPGQYEYSNFQGFSGLDAGYADGGDIQKSVNLRDWISRTKPIEYSYEGADDFSADRQRVEDALMARMQPYLDRRLEETRSNTANQGFMLGSEGYTRSMDDYNRAANDATLGAILNAGEEQARMVGMARDAAAFNNQAQAQHFGQNLTRADFENQAQLAEGTFANQAQAQAFGQDRTNIDASNNALQQMYDNYFRATSANNALQDSRFNQDAALYSMEDDARTQALQELYQLRNQPINEITALLSGAQVSPAGFTNTPQYQIPTTDYAGIMQQDYANRLAASQQGGFGSQMMGGLFGLGAGYLAGGYPLFGMAGG